VVAGPPAFGVALAHVWPSPYAEAAIEVTRRAVAALGIEDGPSYTRLRLSRGGPEVLEVSPRLGGGHNAELVHAATGVDLNELALAAALGMRLTSAGVTARSPALRRRDHLPRTARHAEAVECRRAERCRDAGLPRARYEFGPLRRAPSRRGRARRRRDARRQSCGRAWRPSAYAS
jgi:biotin carboxylase